MRSASSSAVQVRSSSHWRLGSPVSGSRSCSSARARAIHSVESRAMSGTANSGSSSGIGDGDHADQRGDAEQRDARRGPAGPGRCGRRWAGRRRAGRGRYHSRSAGDREIGDGGQDDLGQRRRRPRSSGFQGCSTDGTRAERGRARARAAPMPRMSTAPCSTPCRQRCRRATPTRTTTARLTRPAGTQPYSSRTARVRAAPEPVPPHQRSRPSATRWPTMMPVSTASDQPTVPAGKSAWPSVRTRKNPVRQCDCGRPRRRRAAAVRRHARQRGDALAAAGPAAALSVRPSIPVPLASAVGQPECRRPWPPDSCMPVPLAAVPCSRCHDRRTLNSRPQTALPRAAITARLPECDPAIPSPSGMTP